MHFPKIILLLSLSFSTLSSAEINTREIEFKVVTAGIFANLTKIYLPSDVSRMVENKYTGEWIEVELNQHTATGPYQAKVGARLNFFKKSDIMSGSAGLVGLAEEVKRWIFLLIPTAEGYRIQPIPDDEIEWGAYSVYNFSGAPLKVEMGKKSKVIANNLHALFKSSDEAQWVKITGVVKSKPRILRQTKWQLDANQREFVIYYRQPNQGVGARHIIDHKPDERPE